MDKLPRKVIVVGGGLAGLSCTMRLAESGFEVALVSITKVKRSHSVCAQGGINAAMNVKNEGDSPLIHAYETIKGGDFLADQPPVVEMCCAAPHIIQMMDRLGCPFNRTPEGYIDVRRFGGSLYHRTVFCGASTGQQLLYTLDEQVRRYEAKGRVKKYENHECMRLVLDEEGRARGIVFMDHFNMRLDVIRADAVVIATGGLGVIFRKSTNSTFCTGVANGRLFMQGMQYANPEFIQIHPTAIPGEDKFRLISESVRGEGGRMWVWGDATKRIQAPNGQEIPCGKTGEPWYFFEELYPAYGNLVPRDIAAREILRLCEMGLGIDGKDQVFLDVTQVPHEMVHRIRSVLEIYEKFTGEDPRRVPMKIFPAVHYSMGGAWVDFPAQEDSDRWSRFRQMTNIRGLFAIGEAEFLYHGANRLGANSLLSCIFGGLVAAAEMHRYVETLSCSSDEVAAMQYEQALDDEMRVRRELLSRSGEENLFMLHEELAEWMVSNVTVRRNNRDLERTIQKIFELKERAKRAPVNDSSSFVNQTLIFAAQFEPMLEIAHIITQGALLRNESRGSHAKQEFPQRDDVNWLKTTVVASRGPQEAPHFFWLPVDTRYVSPTLRDYTKREKEIPHFENLPANITLPV